MIVGSREVNDDDEGDNHLDTDIVKYNFVNEGGQTCCLFHLSEVQKVFVQIPARS